MLAADFDRLPVQQWLDRIGARMDEDAYGAQALFPEAGASLPAPGTMIPLPDLGVIEVSGADAVKFLHSQLTQNVETLGEDLWRRFGYCNAKGRMQLSAIGIRSGDTVQLICSRALAGPLAKRLGMFVMRSKAKVADVSAAHEIYGVLGATPALLEALGLAAPVAEAKLKDANNDPVGARLPFRQGELEGDALVLAAGDALKAQGVGMSGAAPMLVRVPAGSALWARALAAGMTPGNSADWRIGEVAAAVARIVPATHECFVPQMINFESVAGVDFKKGCYPGQEVVARSQYLGKLKRRMHVGWIAAGPGAFEPQPAQDVWLQEGTEPSGQVVLAGRAGKLGYGVLFEVSTSALEQGPVGVRDTAGQWQAIESLALPYALLEI